MIPLQSQRVIISSQENVVENQMKNPLNKEKQGLEKENKERGHTMLLYILIIEMF